MTHNGGGISLSWVRMAPGARSRARAVSGLCLAAIFLCVAGDLWLHARVCVRPLLKKVTHPGESSPLFGKKPHFEIQVPPLVERSPPLKVLKLGT